jgi:hypothetical protein
MMIDEGFALMSFNKKNLFSSYFMFSLSFPLIASFKIVTNSSKVKKALEPEFFLQSKSFLACRLILFCINNVSELKRKFNHLLASVCIASSTNLLPSVSSRAYKRFPTLIMKILIGEQWLGFLFVFSF